MPALHPQFVENMKNLLGSQCDGFLRALEEKPALALRLNPLREGAEAVSAAFLGDRVPWAQQGYYLREGSRPGAGLAHFCGAFYMQEASAMLPVSALGVMPGEKILDLCAAPGGKSSQIAFALGTSGLLVANEPEPKRARMLAGNLERLGVYRAVVSNEYPERLAEKWAGQFDAVLVDAPCSGEGMFRRDPDSRDQWNPSSPEGCARRQRSILESAAELVAPGGRLVYSTCTYNDVEDEGVAEAFLAAHPEFSAEDFALPGLPPSRGGMLKILPHLVRGDGQFAARMVKSASQKPARKKPAPILKTRGENPMELWERFGREFEVRLPELRPEKRGDYLFGTIASAPDSDGLRIVTPGLALARIAGSRLEPAHPAAMALGGFAGAELDDERALAYVRGEEVPCEGRGWLVARWRGLPLGWGKASGGVLKNHLPKGLRRAMNAESSCADGNLHHYMRL